MIRKTIQFSLTILMAAMMTVIPVSCGDDDGDTIENGYTNTEKEDGDSKYDLTTINKLKGTSWKWVRNEYYTDGVFNRSINGDNSIITFSDEQVKNDEYLLYVNGIKKGTWEPWPSNEGRAMIMMNWQSDEDRAKYGLGCIIYTLSATELIMGHSSTHHCFVSSEGNTGGGSSSGNAPNFIDFSYTYTSSSVTVIFHTDTDITNGTVYYGKSSASTAVSSSYTTVGRHMVQATIRNLNKSTKYYVKCMVKNSYGSTTSDVLSVMTGN